MTTPIIEKILVIHCIKKINVHLLYKDKKKYIYTKITSHEFYSHCTTLLNVSILDGSAWQHICRIEMPIAHLSALRQYLPREAGRCGKTLRGVAEQQLVDTS